MRNGKTENGENEFAEMEHMNITVITSNKPYQISDGSNLFFDGFKIPKFNLKRNGVHSGHVQIGIQNPFCLVKNRKRRCKVSSGSQFYAVPQTKIFLQYLVSNRAPSSLDHNLKLRISLQCQIEGSCFILLQLRISLDDEIVIAFGNFVMCDHHHFCHFLLNLFGILEFLVFVLKMKFG
ncbi:unnamed protein product [Fraxinus pennsylvanica]|uniref:Uncharacterized protein n=1 Tax=Fraxinus pennsylvanica TaxID=56036 RepID=A0AAD2AHL3_9LAMI|nr:unnamed protein product [Fraxinus pennsylvanica]